MAMDPASGLAWPSDRHALRGGSAPVGAVPPRAGSTVAVPVAVAGRWWRLGLPGVIGTLALACRLVPVLRGGGLSGVDTYDPSVYYAAAVGLFTGRMPYRDFLLLHPPGILLALQPFAVLGAVVGDPLAMESARVAFMLLGAGSSLLIYRILLPHHRYGAALGAATYAVWYPAIYAERSVRLEALATFVLLLGIVAVQRSLADRSWVPLFAAGALFGLGATVKIWGVVPVVTLVVWLALRRVWRGAAAALAGAAAAIALVIAPFAVAGPQMWSMVVLDQLGRPRSPQPLVTRLVDVLGLRFLPPAEATVPAAVLGALAVAALVLALRSRLGELVVLVTLANTVVLLLGPTWFIHYPAFVAAPLCLVYGAAAGELAGMRRARWVRVIAGVVAAAGVSLLGSSMLQASEGTAFPDHLLREVLAARPGCVTTDNPTTLIFSNTLRRNLAEGCPLVVDLSGYIYDIHRNGGDINRASDPTFQRLALNYLESGTTTALIRFGPGDLSRQSRLVIDAWPLVDRWGPLVVRHPLPVNGHRPT
ncbi:MAG TPA: glycosyltransferase 87 family protein [Propionicimonas sp.]|jgi:hypothetical protein